MAPEMLGDGEYGLPLDIFSFGIFAHELANGKPPAQETKAHTFFKLSVGGISPIDKKWSDRFRDFVEKSLIKEPTLRWTAEELLKHDFL
jgi:serine/threonine protein kinase